MVMSLQQQVDVVARKASRLTRWYGVGWFVAIVGFVAILAGTIDYFLRYQDSVLTWLVSGCLWTFGAICFYRYVYRHWGYVCSDLVAALGIERRFPELSDRLSSAMAFARAPMDDALAGSGTLRRAVVTEVSGALEDIDIDQCLDRRATHRAIVAAMIPVIAILIGLVADAESVQIAAARLFSPWSAPAWPHRHDLRFVQPVRRVVRGQDFQVGVVDLKGKLPDDVRVECWPDDSDAPRIEAGTMRSDGSMLVYRRTNVTCGFRVRACGGDDLDMPWIRVDVVPPPAIKQFELTLHPPGYTGLPERKATRTFQALEGTRITFHARTDQALSVALLQTDTTTPVKDIGLALDADKSGFSLPLQSASHDAWVVTTSGSYHLRLFDGSGLDAGAVIDGDVRVIADAPPAVAVKRPAVNLNVTPQAQIPLAVVGQDDLAVASIRLQYRVAGHTDPVNWTSVDLWSGTPRPTLPTGGNADPGIEDESIRTVEYVWDLTTLAELRPGQIVEFRATVSDYKPQLSESEPRRLTIISVDKLLADIAAAQSEILRRIADIVQLQRQTRNQTGLLGVQLKEVGRIDRSDVDQLQSIEVNQRQVRQRLVDPGDSVHVEIAKLLDQLSFNRVDRPETARRLAHLDDVVTRLDRHALGTIQNDLVDALTTAQDRVVLNDETRGSSSKSVPMAKAEPDAGGHGSGTAADVESLLQRAGENQGLVIDDLERLLREFSQWDSFQQLLRQLGHILQSQDAVWQSTRKLQAQTLGKVRLDLTMQQRADLRRVADQQTVLSRDFDRWLGSLEQTREQLRLADPKISDLLAEAWSFADDQAISAQMYDAGVGLQTNQLGQVVETQRKAVIRLTQLLSILENPREQRTRDRLRRLQDAAARIGQLQQSNRQVATRLSQPDPPTTAELQQLGPQEAKLGADAEALRRLLQELGVGKASAFLQQAGQAMSQAGRTAQSGQLESSRKHVEQAAQDLSGAEQELQAAVRAAQQQLEQSQQDALSLALDAIAETQRDVLQRTREVEQRRQQQNAEESDDEKQVEALAGQQEQIRLNTDRLVEANDQYLAFDFALRRIAQAMEKAHELLRTQKTDLSTQRYQQRSLDEIGRLRAALQSIAKQPDASQKPTPESPNESKEGQGGDVRLLAQLKLVRMMQAEVNRETKQLRSIGGSGNWTDELVQRYQTLIQYQAELANILGRLISRPQSPDSAPGADPMNDLERALQRQSVPDNGPKRPQPKRSRSE